MGEIKLKRGGISEGRSAGMGDGFQPATRHSGGL